MLGYPGETEDDILKTLDHLKNANPDIFTITTAYPIKGRHCIMKLRALIPEYPGNHLLIEK